jgi:protein-L-isoaspartate(D-aspartate) O-methyltransferase
VVEATRYRRARERMVAELEARGIRDARVLAALREVPRHELIPEALRHRAYDDCALPIGAGQTISAPYVVALMSQHLELRGDENVLEIGTGSAYQCAVLSKLAARVTSIERLPSLADRARTALDRLRVENAVVYLGDGTRGRPGAAPFDAVAVTAAGPEVPVPLLSQLADGGRLIGPFGPRDSQQLLRVDRLASGEMRQTALGRCRFVDLVGAHGWSV